MRDGSARGAVQAARNEVEGCELRPYAALSCALPDLLRCTNDLRLAIGASSSSAIAHATPSDTKYACAWKGVLSVATTQSPPHHVQKFKSNSDDAQRACQFLLLFYF